MIKTSCDCLSLAQRGKGNYIIKDGFLNDYEMLFGQYVENLVVTEGEKKSCTKTRI